jgi:hypothetical protein
MIARLWRGSKEGEMKIYSVFADPVNTLFICCQVDGGNTVELS